MDFPEIQFPNNVNWPGNPFEYTILFVDYSHGKDTNFPIGPGQLSSYLNPWQTVHNLEWFSPNPNNTILARKDQNSPWVDITSNYTGFRS
jgi:hypothetical protein